MLEEIKSFKAVVEHGSLNKAARHLNLSQPALSRKIAALEQDWGVRLFDRRGKKLVLTGAGETAYAHAEELLRMEQRLLQALSKYRQEHKHRLVIGASLTTLQSTLPDLISFLTDSGVPLEISAVTGKTHEIARLVQEQRADVGLIASEVNDPDLHCIRLFRDRLVLVLPDTHPLLAGGNVHKDALQQLPMIVFSKGTWYRILMDELFQQHRLAPDIRMEIDSFEAIIRLIPTCGLAALLPASYLRPGILEDNGLAAVDIPELSSAMRTTSLIYSKTAAWPDDVRKAIMQAASRLQR